MHRFRLEVPLHLYLRANDPKLLDPSLTFDHGRSTVDVRLAGGIPLSTAMPEGEADFRTISSCRIEIRDEDEIDTLSKLIDARDHQGLVDFVLPIRQQGTAGD